MVFEVTGTVPDAQPPLLLYRSVFVEVMHKKPLATLAVAILVSVRLQRLPLPGAFTLPMREMHRTDGWAPRAGPAVRDRTKIPQKMASKVR